MIDFWEFHYWSEHVPNDGLDEVIYLVRLCAEAYKTMVDYLLPKQYVGRLNPYEYRVEIVEKPYHTEVIINRTGDTI